MNINKDEMANAYVEMGMINLGIAENFSKIKNENISDDEFLNQCNKIMEGYKKYMKRSEIGGYEMENERTVTSD